VFIISQHFKFNFAEHRRIPPICQSVIPPTRNFWDRPLPRPCARGQKLINILVKSSQTEINWIFRTLA